MSNLEQLFQQMTVEELRLAAKILSAPAQPKFAYANLLRGAKYGDKISLGKIEANSWRLGPQGIFFRRDKEFFQIMEDKSVKSWGRHEYGGWDSWEVNAQGIFTYREFHQCKGGEFYRVLDDGSEKSLGKYEFAQWRLGPQGIFIVYFNDVFVQIVEDGQGKVFGGHKYSQWEINSQGIVSIYGDELWLIPEDGVAKRMGIYKNSSVRVTSNEIFVSGGDGGRDFFQIMDSKSKRSLGNHKHDSWDVGPAGVFLKRGDNFFQILEDESEKFVCQNETEFPSFWKVGPRYLVCDVEGEFVLVAC